jgi:hypothetical protein
MRKSLALCKQVQNKRKMGHNVSKASLSHCAEEAKKREPGLDRQKSIEPRLMCLGELGIEPRTFRCSPTAVIRM